MSDASRNDAVRTALRGSLTAVLIGYLVLWATLLHIDVERRNLVLYLAALVVFAAAVLVLARARLAPRPAAWLVVGTGGLLQVIAMTRAPLTSDDASRYSWDGKVQLAGIDPYHYVPSSPALAHLRDGSLFGPTSTCAHHIVGSCTAINRPDVHTIYPPVAQAAFVLARLVSFGGHGPHAGLFVFQLLGALGTIAIGVLLARRALARGTAMWPVALWSWCPIVISEFGNNAHLDWLAVLFVVLAMEAGVRNRAALSGGLVGAAIATKLYPALVLPALMKRKPWVVAGSAIGLVVLVYIPHVVAVGAQVIGYLPGYLQEEGYNSGDRLRLLGAVLPHPADTIVGVLLLVVAALWAWRRSDPGAPEQTATVLSGLALLVTTPNYGWYAAMLLALVVMSGRYEWLAVVVAPTLGALIHANLTPAPLAGKLVFVAAALIVAAGWPLRCRLAKRGRAPSVDAGSLRRRQQAPAGTP